MQKTSKVTAVWPSQDQNGQPRNFQTQHGIFYPHSVNFENGDTGEFNSKTQAQTTFQIGQEATYEISPNPPYADKVKKVNPEFTGSRAGGFKKDSPEQSRSIERQKALDIAERYIGRWIEKGHENLGPKDVKEVAIVFYDFISRPEPQPEPKQQTLNQEYQEKTGIPGVTEEDYPPNWDK